MIALYVLVIRSSMAQKQEAVNIEESTVLIEL